MSKTHPNLAGAEAPKKASELNLDGSGSEVRRHREVRDASDRDDYDGDLMEEPRATRGLKDFTCQRDKRRKI